MIEGLPAQKFGQGLPFARVTAVAERLGLDLAAFGARSLLIVGSNGKGTTAAAAAAALQTARAKVGLFTSPHLISVRERFAINGALIPDERLQRLSLAVAAAAAAMNERLGAFEHLFLMAALWFEGENCDAVVWEAGIGGRYDCTRLVQAKHGALVSLDLEHTALLGATLELIALDKLDGFAAGALVQCGASTLPLADQLLAYARLTQRHVQFSKGPTEGGFLAHNRALGVRTVADFLEMAPDEDFAPLVAAAEQAHLPGRLETLATDPLTVIDIGHTPAAARAAAAGFAALAPGPRALLIGVSPGKDAAGIVDGLAPQFDRIACVAARHSGQPAQDILAHVRVAAPGARAEAFTGVHEALQTLQKEGRAILAAGSLYVAAEVKAAHLGLDPAALWYL